MFAAKSMQIIVVALAFASVAQSQYLSEKLGCGDQVCAASVCEDGTSRRPLGSSCCACPEDNKTPIDRVLILLDNLLNDISLEEDRERESFDRYDAWCNTTVEEKSSSLTSTGERVKDLMTLIEKAKGEYGQARAEISQLNKGIKMASESLGEAEGVREKESKKFRDQLLETKQALNALDTAINYLETATKGSFLGTKKQAELSNVVAAVRTALNKDSLSRVVRKDQLAAVKPFIESPQAFFGGSLKVSALQNGASPYGDYAPQSDQIRGILKQMRDEFQEDLDALQNEENFKVQTFTELANEKNADLTRMQTTLDETSSYAAQRDRYAAEQKAIRDDVMAQQQDDIEFVRDVKSGCISKRADWNQRTNARKVEIVGVKEAIDVLTSAEAQATFQATAAAAFLQVSSNQQNDAPALRTKAYAELKKVLAKSHSLSLAKVAVLLKKGGVFDDVIKQLNEMIALKRAEGKEDQEHRDRCDAAMDQNRIKLENLGQEVGALERKKQRTDTAVAEGQAQVAQYEIEINETETNLRNMKAMRDQDAANHRESVKANQDAIGFLITARLTLEQLTKKPAGAVLLQAAQEPVAPTAAPMTNFEGSYHGRQTRASGIVTILGVIEEDLQKEINEAEAAEAVALKEFEQQYGALRSSWEMQLVAKNAAQKEVAELMQKSAAVAEEQDQKNEEVAAQESIKESLVVDCAWVATHFTARHNARQAEIDGMVRAMAILEEGNVEEGDRISRTRTGEDTTPAPA